jgi:hypothetical protein
MIFLQKSLNLSDDIKGLNSFSILSAPTKMVVTAAHVDQHSLPASSRPGAEL